LFKHELLDHI
jgi:glutaminase